MRQDQPLFANAARPKAGFMKVLKKKSLVLSVADDIKAYITKRSFLLKLLSLKETPMKPVSKKFLQKLANKTNLCGRVIQSPNMTNDITIEIQGTEKKDEVYRPQEKWSYPIADHVPECGFVWAVTNYISGPNTNWVKHEGFYRFDLIYVLPDPNNPDKPPKKNWRPK